MLVFFIYLGKITIAAVAEKIGNFYQCVFMAGNECGGGETCIYVTKICFFYYRAAAEVRRMLHTGIVTMERMVDATTSRVANNSSAWYLEARILVVAPAGIPVKRTHTPATSAGTPVAIQIA